MTTEEKFKLITRNLEETLTEEELKQLLDSNTPLKHYIGFEISGKLHIGHFYQLMKVKDLQEAGAETTIFLADYHSAVNDKLGGDIETIKRVANDYFIPAMKVLFECIGGDPEKLVFKLCSDEYAKHPEFWMTFLEMAKATSLSRSKRSITIMGREAAEDSIETAKIMYPIMQAADIFLLQTNIAQAGIDQRKVHVIARDNALQIKTSPLRDSSGKQIKPIAIHTPILLGLSNPVLNTKEGEGLSGGSGQSITLIKLGQHEDEDNRDLAAMRIKMSKSKANSAVSIHDTAEEIMEKISKAYAPPKDIIFNPILGWAECLVFYEKNTVLTIKRKVEHGGDKSYMSYNDLRDDYSRGDLHPQDLKVAVAQWLIEKLEPARKYFEEPSRKAALDEITKLTTKN